MLTPLVLALVISATSIVVALAMLFLVLWQAARRPGNRLMALYMATVIGWSLSGLAVRLAILAGQDPSFFFVGVLQGIALNSLALFALAAYYARRGRYWLLLFAAGLIYYLGLPLLFPGNAPNRFVLTPEGVYYYRFDPLGAFNFALVCAFYAATLFVLWKHRRQKAGDLLPGAVVVMLGVLSALVPALTPYSLPIIGAALSAILFARAILRQDLFNPLVELNRQLAENESRLRTLITGAPVVLFALDQHGVFTLLEGKGLEALGANPANVVGRSIFQLEQPIPQVTEVIQRALAGETATSAVEIGDLVFETRCSPVRDEQGNVTGVIGVSTDITERRRAQAALEQHISRLEFLERVEIELGHKLNVDYVLPMVLDVAVRATLAEAACICLSEGEGVRAAHIIGHYPQSLLGSYIPPEQGILGRVVRLRQPQLVLDVTHDPDYVAVTPFTRAQMAIPLLSQDRLVGVICLETEYPERFTAEKFEFLKLLASRIAAAIDNARLYQQSQEQLAELRGLYEKVSALEQVKTDMIRIAAHDLRNPLGLITGYLHFIHEDLRPQLSEKTEAFFAAIERGVTRMEAITSDILSLQKIEQAAEGSNREKIELRALVERAYHDHQHEAQRKTQQFQLNLPPDPLTVWGDPAQLQEAVANLVTNAVKYTPDGGSVQVRLTEQDSTALFEVVDTGYGVPEDQQARLFEPFFRADSDETRKIEGTGLGLHLVKNIVERHHGQMWFASVYGQGSTFGFRLPLWKEN
jgi:PAS domain S-box-containing protein